MNLQKVGDSGVSPAAGVLLEARGLAVGIPGRSFCSALDFVLHGGESVAILGRNGAGKSSLLATLAGFAAPRAGEVLIGGKSIAAQTPREVALLRGFLPQTHHDAFASTVLETVLVGRHPHLARWQWEGADDVALVRQALAHVGMAGMEQRTLHSLSGGERQRLAIATLLVQKPGLYLLDEPLTHLDLNHAIAALEIFARLAEQGAGVLMVLHDPGLAARYCQRVLLLYGDGTCVCGPSQELLTAERLSGLYGHTMRALDDGGRPWFVP